MRALATAQSKETSAPNHKAVTPPIPAVPTLELESSIIDVADINSDDELSGIYRI